MASDAEAGFSCASGTTQEEVPAHLAGASRSLLQKEPWERQQQLKKLLKEQEQHDLPLVEDAEQLVDSVMMQRAVAEAPLRVHEETRPEGPAEVSAVVEAAAAASRKPATGAICSISNALGLLRVSGRAKLLLLAINGTMAAGLHALRNSRVYAALRSRLDGATFAFLVLPALLIVVVLVVLWERCSLRHSSLWGSEAAAGAAQRGRAVASTHSKAVSERGSLLLPCLSQPPTVAQLPSPRHQGVAHRGSPPWTAGAARQPPPPAGPLESKQQQQQQQQQQEQQQQQQQGEALPGRIPTARLQTPALGASRSAVRAAASSHLCKELVVPNNNECSLLLPQIVPVRGSQSGMISIDDVNGMAVLYAGYSLAAKPPKGKFETPGKGKRLMLRSALEDRVLASCKDAEPEAAGGLPGLAFLDKAEGHHAVLRPSNLGLRSGCCLQTKHGQRVLFRCEQQGATRSYFATDNDGWLLACTEATADGRRMLRISPQVDAGLMTLAMLGMDLLEMGAVGRPGSRPAPPGTSPTPPQGGSHSLPGSGSCTPKEHSRAHGSNSPQLPPKDLPPG